MIVRSDCGSENGLVASMESYFRAGGDDEFAGANSHQYGSSPANQRIEGWWSSFRQSRSDWWINFFKDMCESRIIELGNAFHMECIWFCFSRVIQNELDKVKDHWNSHYIRRSCHDTVPGVPDILYYLEENVAAANCLVPVSQAQIQQVEPQCDMDVEDNVYQAYFQYVMGVKGWDYPLHEKDAFDMFQSLKLLQG